MELAAYTLHLLTFLSMFQTFLIKIFHIFHKKFLNLHFLIDYKDQRSSQKRKGMYDEANFVLRKLAETDCIVSRMERVEREGPDSTDEMEAESAGEIDKLIV